MFISVGSAVPQWRDHKVRILAVGAAKRLAGLPEIPTVAESGPPGYEAVSWFGLFGPAGMPAALVSRLYAAVQPIFSDAAVVENVGLAMAAVAEGQCCDFAVIADGHTELQCGKLRGGSLALTFPAAARLPGSIAASTVPAGGV